MCEAAEVMENEELVHHLDKPLSAVDFRVLPSKKRGKRERERGRRDREREREKSSNDFTTCNFLLIFIPQSRASPPSDPSSTWPRSIESCRG